MQKLQRYHSSRAGGALNGQTTSGGLHVFAGRRSDPFFLNLKWSTAAGTEGKLLPPQNDNIMQNLNALSIVLLIDIEQELGSSEGPLFAVAAKTTTQDSGADSSRQIDRIGRPEITNVSMVPHDGVELRDLYNAEEPFSGSGKNFGLFRQRLRENIAYYDRLNGTIEWTPETSNHLVEILLNDFLVVDVSKPSATTTYFEIEHAVLRGEPHSTCGGRAPNDDIMDVLFTLLINGGNPPRIRDGVDQPTRLATDVFPYLAEPNDGIGPAIKSFIAGAAGKLTIPGRMRWIGIMQLLSGVAALIGTLVLLFYGVRLGVARIARREYPASRRALFLGIGGVLFGVATLFGLITSAFSLPVIGMFAVICIFAFRRFVRWKRQGSGLRDISVEAPA